MNKDMDMNRGNRGYLYSNILYNDCNKLDENWTEEEIKLIFATLENSTDYLKTIWGEWMKARDLCILASLRYMLLRPKEACCMKFSDLDMKIRRIKIRGVNNKQKKDRFVQIPDNFIKYFVYYMSFPKWMWKGSEYLFPSAENAHISPERWKMIFREKSLKPAGLYEKPEGKKMPRTRSYLLRQTGATELLDSSNDPWLVAQILGHSDLRTIKNYFFQTKSFQEKQKFFLNKIK